MIKVDNAKTVRRLSGRDYLGNKGRNLFILIAIIMTSFLITAVCSLGGSYWRNITNRSLAMHGILYDITLPGARPDQAELARNDEKVTAAGMSVKCAAISEYEGKKMDIQLSWAEPEHWEKQCAPAFEFVQGAYPQKDNELMLSTRSLRQMGIDAPTVGMELDVLWKTLPESSDTVDKEGKFYLSGYYRDKTSDTRGYVSESFYKNSGADPTDLTLGTLYISLKNPLYSPADIDGFNESLELTPDQIISADRYLLASFIKMAAALILLLLLIFSSGYLFIYNILYISITKDVKHFGQLKVLGMTDAQMRKYVWWQVLWNLCIGLPLGLGLGALVSTVVVPMIIKATSSAYGSTDAIIFHPVILLTAAVFSVAAVCFGSRKPIRLAGKLSPVEATRYTGAGKGIQKRPTHGGGKISGMALWNVFRNKGQAVAVLVSLVLVMTAFLVVSSIISGKNAKNILDRAHYYDFRVVNYKLLDDDQTQVIGDDFVDSLASMEGIKSVHNVYSHSVSFEMDDPLIQNYFYNYFHSSLFPDSKYDSIMEEWRTDPDYNLTTGWLVGIDAQRFEVLNEEMGGTLDTEAFLNGDIAFISDMPVDTDAADNMVGETLKLRITGTEAVYSVPIAEQLGVVSLPNYLSSGYGPLIVVHESLFKQWVKVPVRELVDVVYDESYNKAMDDKLRGMLSDTSGVFISTKMDDYEDLAGSELQISVLGNGLCVILAGLAILNFGNMMAISIQNRRREFATLSGIGMTRGQILRMLLLEGVYYGGFAVGITLIFGVPAAKVIVQAVNDTWLEYPIPIAENVVMFSIFLLCCLSLPVVLYKVMQKGSIVEQLRRE